MPIVRWEPFRNLVSSQDQFNRLFNETFSRFFSGAESGEGQAWTPAVDVYEDEHNLVLKAELPGLDPNDVEVRVEDNVLCLKGQRKFEKDVKQENYHRIERAYGSFQRTFTLPNTVNANQVTAEYKNGVLILTMPKREEAKPKTIKIQVADASPKAVAAAAQK